MQRQRGQRSFARRRQHRLVGEVHHRVAARRQPPQRLLRIGLDRPAVVLVERPGAELLLAAAEHHAGQVEPGERVADGRRVVLAVDQRDDGHAVSRGAVSPSSDWSFSYSYVRGSNERIASCSWKGYLRNTVTRSGLASITL